MGRRGMSPLIATVLLMAFAVALGGMIMNLRIDLGTDDACKGITVRIDQFCARDRQIDLILTNLPESQPIAGVKVLVLDSGVESALTVKDSDVAPGKDLRIGIPFAAGADATASIIGIVGSPSAPYACVDTPLYTADPLPPC